MNTLIDYNEYSQKSDEVYNLPETRADLRYPVRRSGFVIDKQIKIFL